MPGQKWWNLSLLIRANCRPYDMLYAAKATPSTPPASSFQLLHLHLHLSRITSPDANAPMPSPPPSAPSYRLQASSIPSKTPCPVPHFQTNFPLRGLDPNRVRLKPNPALHGQPIHQPLKPTRRTFHTCTLRSTLPRNPFRFQFHYLWTFGCVESGSLTPYRPLGKGVNEWVINER